MRDEDRSLQSELQPTEYQVTEEITRKFQDAGLEVHRDVVVGGSRSDVYAIMPTGGTAVFEVKMWPPTPENVSRAERLAGYYASASGADRAFVVMPDLGQSQPALGILAMSDLDEVVGAELLGQPGTKGKERPTLSPKPDRTIFAAMPFDGRYDDTYVVAMQPACHWVNAECVRVDYQTFTGDVVTEVRRLIRGSIAVISDLSESRPNVLYEQGIAEGIGLPVVQICSTSLECLPFDVRNNKTLQYCLGRTSRFRSQLARELGEVLQIHRRGQCRED